MASKCKKSQIWPYRPWKMTFRAIQPNLSLDMWFMSPKRSSMPKKEEKLLKRFWDRPLPPPPPLNLDGRMDRRTTDKSVLEKLCCLSAGGAKKTVCVVVAPLTTTLYMSTPQQQIQDSNPEPSDHESHTLCMLPPSKKIPHIFQELKCPSGKIHDLLRLVSKRQ